jgi:uncharacterized membrane protein YfcA
MITSISKATVILFGAYIIIAGFIMLFAPQKARATLRKAGSTNLINYTEITVRLVIGVAIVLCADVSRVPLVFTIFGWFIIVTSLMLLLVPRKLHHAFSMRSADILKPFYFQIIAPFAFLFGGSIIYNLL